MPCFKGLAVSIHSDGPLPEYSIQRQSRVSRITSYIPVPAPNVNSQTGQVDPASFSISITLLTPGLSVPYSTPKPSSDNPYPKPQMVGGLPGFSSQQGSYISPVGPYESLTSSPNETVAAYIYFDGRQKEEVATLLRRGEETWVNSRWVSVPASEGGGLAERDFLFREVGLERWLNGLDLQGKDAAAQVERRRRRLEKKRRQRTDTPGSNEEDDDGLWRPRRRANDKNVLRYGTDAEAPLERVSDEDDDVSTDEDSDDDPIPESTGQIKVALFRVLASGEIKKGEYSPQFDAHDDDDESNGNNGEGGADVEHTTSFAKPKALDPKSISTQTVTGIDGPDKPYAVFTFLYRGEKQLQKMGILKSKKPTTETPAAGKRRSVQTDFANLKPLKPGGAVGFTKIRDATSPEGRNGKEDDDDMSEEDEDKEKFPADAEGEDFKNRALSPEDARKAGELTDGVKKIKLKRQHSFEPPVSSTGETSASKSPTNITTDQNGNTPPLLSSAAYDPGAEAKAADSAIIGSPLKKQRASMSNLDNSEATRSTADAVARGLGFGFVGDTNTADGSAGGLRSASKASAGTLDASSLGFGGELPKPKSSLSHSESAPSDPKENVKMFGEKRRVDEDEL